MRKYPVMIKNKNVIRSVSPCQPHILLSTSAQFAASVCACVYENAETEQKYSFCVIEYV